MAAGTKLAIRGLTDVGLARDHNEDFILWDEQLGLVLLADGMGGHNAGEVASELAADTIKLAVHEALYERVRAAAAVDAPQLVQNAVIHANEQIFDQAQEKPECAGMGTTLALALFQDDSAVFAHVGDSRIYRLRGGELDQITSDHSLVQELVDNGYLSEEEARLSVSRNLITRALGIAENVEADVREDRVEIGDLYLFCSDGLSDLVGDEDLKGILETHRGDMDSAARSLVDLANQKGGTDNISVILVSIEEAFSDDNGIGAA